MPAPGPVVIPNRGTRCFRPPNPARAARARRTARQTMRSPWRGLRCQPLWPSAQALRRPWTWTSPVWAAGALTGSEIGAAFAVPIGATTARADGAILLNFTRGLPVRPTLMCVERRRGGVSVAPEERMTACVFARRTRQRLAAAAVGDDTLVREPHIGGAFARLPEDVDWNAAAWVPVAADAQVMRFQ